MSVLKQILSTVGLHSVGVLRTKSASFSSSFNQSIIRAMAAAPTIVLSGPSGSGKSTILTKAMAQHPGKFAFSVSHTTRKPRPGEADGEHYHFVDIPTMKKMIEDGEFFEHAEFGGNLYGTSKKAVKEGVINFKKSKLPAKYILITPPAIEILKKRLESRGTETEDSMEKRLSTAKKDLEIVERNADLFDYVVVNDELDHAYSQFINLIMEDLKKHGNTATNNNNQVAA
uniref:Guanylate kinase-like domain-containing protein n=1 Tax=Ditylenchus dipsaci TaxID=166011 RepID=A0A915EF81_9BILA